MGKIGEDIAADYLRRNNYRIIERNYRCPLGEIDIVALDGQTIVFVEVKSKLTDRFGRPEEAVDWKKRRKLSRAALSYLVGKHSLDRPARFDVVSVGINADGPADIVLFRNAFELAGS